jgi:hypothetical protein
MPRDASDGLIVPFEQNAEEISEFADEIPEHLNEIAMETIMAREDAIRNLTMTFGAKLQVIAGDLKCQPQCVE